MNDRNPPDGRAATRFRPTADASPASASPDDIMRALTPGLTQMERGLAPPLASKYEQILEVIGVKQKGRLRTVATGARQSRAVSKPPHAPETLREFDGPDVQRPSSEANGAVGSLVPVAKTLGGWFDKPFDELPDRLQRFVRWGDPDIDNSRGNRVPSNLATIWDRVDPESRQEIARQWDSRPDPSRQAAQQQMPDLFDAKMAVEARLKEVRLGPCEDATKRDQHMTRLEGELKGIQSAIDAGASFYRSLREAPRDRMTLTHAIARCAYGVAIDLRYNVGANGLYLKGREARQRRGWDVGHPSTSNLPGAPRMLGMDEDSFTQVRDAFSAEDDRRWASARERVHKALRTAALVPLRGCGHAIHRAEPVFWGQYHPEMPHADDCFLVASEFEAWLAAGEVDAALGQVTHVAAIPDVRSDSSARQQVHGPSGAQSVKITRRRKDKLETRVGAALKCWQDKNGLDISMNRELLLQKVQAHFAPETISASTLQRALRALLSNTAFGRILTDRDGI
jgi:hypothetical protein